MMMEDRGGDGPGGDVDSSGGGHGVGCDGLVPRQIRHRNQGHSVSNKPVL